MPSFRTTFTPYSHAKALADGEVGLTAGQLEFIRTEPIIGAYRQMVRELAKLAGRQAHLAVGERLRMPIGRERSPE